MHLISSTLLATLLCALTAPLASAQAVDLERLLDQRLAQTRTGSIEVLWADVAHLTAQAGPDGREKLAELALRRLGKAQGENVLFLCGLALGSQETDLEPVKDALVGLLDGRQDELVMAAAGLCADARFKTLPAEEREDLVLRLSAVAEDGAREPEAKLEAAQAWYTLGRGEDRRRARARMNEFLSASDPALRSLGALALARSGAEITGSLYEELRRLASLPGDRGRLAQSYLDSERVREQLERRIKDLHDDKGDDPVRSEVKRTSGDELDQFARVLWMIEKWHLEGDKVKRTDLLAAALDGMLGAMDEHSSYFSSVEYSKFEQDLEAGYGGIGAYVGEDPEDGLFTITHPIYSGPAYRAGLVSEDKVLRVDDWPTIGRPVDEVIKRLKGRPGTKVKLYVWRRGMDRALIDRPTEDLAVEIVRESITIPPVQSALLPGNVGLVTLREFSRVASSELRQPILDLLDQGAESLVLDLRNNSGGLLDEAISVASLFLPNGTAVVSTDSRVEGKQAFTTQTAPILPGDMPMAVLTNRFTASAAEIVAGALQDHQRAVIVGQRSFGKGSVQNLIKIPGLEDDRYEDENGNGRHDNWEKIGKDWNNDGEFDYAPRVKLTIARYLLPSGRSIHRELDKDGSLLSEGGVEPDRPIDFRRLDSWRIEEMLRIRNTRTIRDWVDRHFKSGEAFDKERFFQIADNDRHDTALYPGFQALYDSLDTPLPPDDLRMLVRAEIRRRAQDLRGKEFPQGDFVEDEQLQEAIRVVLDRRGRKPADFEAYQAVIPERSLARVPLKPAEKIALREALDQLERARRGEAQLSPEMLHKLEELLQNKLRD